jgi:hypothetical protein
MLRCGVTAFSSAEPHGKLGIDRRIAAYRGWSSIAADLSKIGS